MCDDTYSASVLTVHPLSVNVSCGEFDSYQLVGSDKPSTLTVNPDEGVIVATFNEARAYTFTVEFLKDGVVVGRYTFHVSVVSGVGTEDIITDDTAIPEKFGILANYPNPFNPSTTIGFTLPAPGKVRILILDLLGRTISQYTAEVSAGTHHWNFDASGLASGTYLYNVSSSFGSVTGKMMLSR